MIMNAQETLFVDPTIVVQTIQLLGVTGQPVLIVVSVSDLNHYGMARYVHTILDERYKYIKTVCIKEIQPNKMCVLEI